MSNKKYISIGEASKYTGVGIQSLRRLAKKDSLQYYKAPSGRYKFNLESLSSLCGHVDAFENTGKNIIYCRVNSKEQEGDLQRQVEHLLTQFPSYEVITDIGSGINFKKKGIRTILELAMQRAIKTLVVAHRDRLCPFGFDIFEQLIKLQGGEIHILDKGAEHICDEQELADDFLSVMHIFSCRQQMARRKSSRKALNKGKEFSSLTDIEAALRS